MSDLLVTLATIFILAAVLLVATNRFPIPAVPVYIVAGLVLPPLVGDDLTLELAQWGIAFLVFIFGVNVEPGRFRTIAKDSEHVAAAQLVIVGGAALAVALGVGLETLDAAYFAIAAALSSSLVGQSLFRREIYLNLVHGRLVQSIHFIQDLFAIAVLLVLSAAVFTLDGVALKLGYGVILLATAVLFRVYAFDWLVKLSGDNDELIILSGIGLLIAFIGSSVAFEVSIAVGAFAAGLAVTRDFPNNLALLSGLDSLNTFFSAIFFVTLGSLVTIPATTTALLEVVLIAGLLTLFVVFVKPLVMVVLLLRRGYETRTACLTSFTLDQVSEFALIIAIQALLLERISEPVFQAIILASAITMITSAATKQYDETLSRIVARADVFSSSHEQLRTRSRVDSDLTDHVVIIGYGILGSRIAAVCDDLGIDVVVIDHDPAQLSRVRAEREYYVFGDAMVEDTLQLANVSESRLVYSTTADRILSDTLLSRVRDPDVIVRAKNTDEALELFEAGATYVAVPDLLASERLLEVIRELSAADGDTTQLRQREIAHLREATTVLRERGRGFVPMSKVMSEDTRADE
ncbi:cation:proton antiporter [Natronococcus occultus]|uniref:Kef-type K+ transport system, membrane component n=1 Tax=Natronococcus occultus SP4 TaxID=694430 RepID=L0JZ44_9EURY|nr:cation:proton antiporter [Natronococcus occultus]AGB37359.1 Kef-type K+ transport system, membrane component [Natronococcus occultus SP4]